MSDEHKIRGILSSCSGPGGGFGGFHDAPSPSWWPDAGDPRDLWWPVRIEPPEVKP